MGPLKKPNISDGLSYENLGDTNELQPEKPDSRKRREYRGRIAIWFGIIICAILVIFCATANTALGPIKAGSIIVVLAIFSTLVIAYLKS